jgi:predicted PhzF superfamily epimerase YddE/YHI9
MKLPIYQVDAFASAVFGGNPAAIVPLESWIDDRAMQSIAEENNLAETAFFVAEGDDFRLRWFTPVCEVDLCGHATLASGWLVLNRLQPWRDKATFHTLSGPLTVAREGDSLAMDLPSRPAAPAVAPGELIAAMGAKPREVLKARDFLFVYGRADDVRGLKPDMGALAKVDCFAVCATAPGDGGHDFISRFFAPRQGVPEDPVTGSAHCTLVPYWAARLNKPRLKAFQASARGGELVCVLDGPRIRLIGSCALYLEGTIHL